MYPALQVIVEPLKKGFYGRVVRIEKETLHELIDANEILFVYNSSGKELAKLTGT